MGRALLAICCGIVGALVGYFGFTMLVQRGFYALVLPGGFLGLAAGIVRTRTAAVAIVCGALAVLAGLITEFRFAPFVADPSASYFFTHIIGLRTETLTIIALGGALGFWVPFRRRLS